MPEAPNGAIRRAERSEHTALAAMLARAFFDDPVTGWVCRPDRLRPRMLERFFGTRLKQLGRHGEIWTTDGLESAAVWAPPDGWKTTVGEDVDLTRSQLHPRLAWRLPLVVRGLLGIQAKHPPQPPHWYLAILGTEPAAQGRGLGSAMLGPILDECDRDGVPAYLESSKERNVAFYGRHGFRVTEELRLPRGPRVWLMWREPRG